MTDRRTDGNVREIIGGCVMVLPSKTGDAHTIPVLLIRLIQGVELREAGQRLAIIHTILIMIMVSYVRTTKLPEW